MTQTLLAPSRLFGSAVADFFYNKAPQDLIVQAQDFADDRIPTDYLFRSYGQMPELEKIALREATGKILDIGACAGSHSLALQDMQKDVCAVDLSEKALAVCKERGVKNTLISDFKDLGTETFDTLLLLMNGTGIAGTFAELPSFFNQLKRLLNPGGQVLLDSSDLRYLYSEAELIYFYDKKEYFGNFTYQIRYKNLKSKEFNWLYLDPETLTEAAKQFGFSTKIIYFGANNDYLAKLQVN